MNATGENMLHIFCFMQKCRWHQVVTFADMDKEPGNGKQHRFSTSSVHHNPYFRNVEHGASAKGSGAFSLSTLLSCLRNLA